MTCKNHNNPKYRVSRTVWNKASSQEKDLQKSQSQFYQTLINDYSAQFKNQSNIYDSIKSAFSPILAAGQDQYGFSAREDASLRTSASDAIAQQQQNAQVALNNTLDSRGGGNAYIPSGAEQQLQAGLLSSAATQQAQASNQITQAGFAQGRQNFLNAAGELSGVASGYNPLGYAGAGTSAGQSAFNMADTINQQNTAWQSALGGALGGIAGSFLGPIGGAVGEKIGSALGGGGNTPGGYQNVS
jgi:hypothetical protein